jgi:hyperosmotically inducible protein
MEAAMLKSLKKMSLLAIALLGVNGAVVAKNNQTPADLEPARLEKEVRHELVMLPFYNVFDNFEFKVESDTVTLFGQVTRPTLKADAEGVVKRIDGVARVDNQIEVLPVSPFDDRIRLAEFRAIYRTLGLDRYALRAIPTIHIIVKNGHVTLEGVVATQADSDLANIKANGVANVFSVTNHLRVSTS